MSKIMNFSGIALKNLFSKPATTEYPAAPKEYFDRTRGHVEINTKDCVLCGICMNSCPPRAIKVDRKTGEWKIQRFDCVQCGYCVEKCPKNALSIIPGYTTPEAVKKEDSFHIEVAAKGAGAQKKVPHNDADTCVFCTLCAKKCPAEALTVDRKEKVWKLDKDKCIGCGACAANCPKKCLAMN